MRQFLRNCEKIEYLAASAYERLAANKGYDSQIRKTFQALSRDEISHARLVDMAQQIPDQELEIVGHKAYENINLFLAYAQALLEEIDQEYQSEVDALQMAIALEKYFLKFHVNNAIEFLNPKIGALFRQLGHHDQKHLELLLDCLRGWKAQLKDQQYPI